MQVDLITPSIHVSQVREVSVVRLATESFSTSGPQVTSCLLAPYITCWGEQLRKEAEDNKIKPS